MPGFEESILTDVGWDALTDAEAGQHIEYTHMEAGDGSIYGGDTEIFGMTNLAHHVMDFPITNFSNDGQGQITLVGTISSKNVTAGFYFRELAVRCTIDGGAPVLYTVSYAGDTGDYIPASTETPVVIQTVQIIIRIDRAPNVTVIVQPGLDVTCQNIGPATVGPGYFRDKIGQICWFKRINSPKKTLLLTETSDLVSIDIPVIDVNLDMFVALGNPDIFPNFSTIQKALDYLIPLRINPGIFVTITVSPGVWNNSASITVKHPQGDQVKIIGTARAGRSITSVTYLGGNPNQNQVQLNAAAGTFSDLVANDFILYTPNYSTVGGICIAGIWQLVGVASDGSWIKYDTNFLGPFPSMGGVSGGTVTPLQTVIKFAAGAQGFVVAGGPGLGLLKNMALRGQVVDANTNHFGFQGNAGTSSLDTVGVNFWGWGGASTCVGIVPGVNGSVIAQNCAACNCNDGFYSNVPGARLQLSTCFGNANLRYGVFATGGALNCYLVTAAGNGADGFIAGQHSAIVMNNCQGVNNHSNGMTSIYHSNIGVFPVAGGRFTGNGSKDIYVAVSSVVARSAGTAIFYGSTNVAPNSLSWDGCMFIP